MVPHSFPQGNDGVKRQPVVGAIQLVSLVQPGWGTYPADAFHHSAHKPHQEEPPSATERRWSVFFWRRDQCRASMAEGYTVYGQTHPERETINGNTPSYLVSLFSCRGYPGMRRFLFSATACVALPQLHVRFTLGHCLKKGVIHHSIQNRGTDLYLVALKPHKI